MTFGPTLLAAALATFAPVSGVNYAPGMGYAYVFATKRDMTVINLPSLKVDGPMRTVWLFTIHETTSTVGGALHDTSAAKTEFDCDGERMRILAVAMNLNGKQVHTENTPTPWAAVVPDTRGAINMKATCDPSTLGPSTDLQTLTQRYRDLRRQQEAETKKPPK